jgi:sugar (pentulose or hexulose) kinase
VLGIDIGTTTSKAAVFALSDTAIPLSVYREPSRTFAPRPGWSEADPDEVVATALRCARAAVTDVDADRVVAIGLTGTACGAWLIDDALRPVRPAILWNDGRAADIVDRWSQDGRMDEVFRLSGNICFPGYTLPVLAWLAEHEPGTLERSHRLLWCKDYVRLALTGEITAEQTDASYAPFNITKLDWDDRLFDLAGVSEHARLFPPVRDPSTTHPLNAHAAETLGLYAGIPVGLGVVDIVSGVTGAGALLPGDAVTLLGTSANSTLVTEQPEFTPPSVGIMAASPTGTYLRTMLNTSGSTTLDWAAEMLTGGSVVRLLEAAARAGDDRPILVPYLAGAGVVSPFVDARARGGWVGLRSSHGVPELARAAVNGLAFAIADNYASMPSAVRQISAVGGAAQSDLLLQTIADTAGVRVIRPRGEEFGARGAALLAAWASGLLEDDELAAEAAALRPDAVFEPDATAPDHEFARYRALRDALRGSGDLW